MGEWLRIAREPAVVRRAVRIALVVGALLILINHPKLIKRIRVDLVTQTDRGYTDDVQQGAIIVDAVRLTGRILSVTIIGPRASEMISLFTLAIQEGISLYKLYRVVYPYPTFSSGIQKVADAFLRETLTGLRGELAVYLRYRWARPTATEPAGRPATSRG